MSDQDVTLAWANRAQMLAVEACLGYIDSSMRAVWVEFPGGNDVVMHFLVSEHSREVEIDARNIADELECGPGPDDIGNVRIEFHLVRPQYDYDDSFLRIRPVFEAKEDV